MRTWLGEKGGIASMLYITTHRKFSDIKEKLKDIVDLEIYKDKHECITFLVKDKCTGKVVNSFTSLGDIEEEYTMK
jgi:nitrate reductase NapAB chaperone NapD